MRRILRNADIQQFCWVNCSLFIRHQQVKVAFLRETDLPYFGPFQFVSRHVSKLLNNNMQSAWRRVVGWLTEPVHAFPRQNPKKRIPSRIIVRRPGIIHQLENDRNQWPRAFTGRIFLANTVLPRGLPA
jgi:hypothetical protein